ncbi:GNAT family N-acetyltransferase [Rhizobium sp. RAF56]|uniref:GNAT family N-acetyltransferase n=1 Tax=Rhizobium sp. RAF56 TaxID=3233062 RepID=UPI003F9C57E0
MVHVRAIAAGDIDQIRAVTLATGDAGRDTSPLYRDGSLISDIYSAPYVRFDPEACLVVEDEAGVAGYIVGAFDTRSFEERLEREWWPELRRIHPDPSGDQSGWSADERLQFMIHHPPRTPDAIVAAFPAHIHMNLLPRLQGRGVGATLLDAWRKKARLAGVRGVHLGADPLNGGALRFWAARGLTRLGPPFADPADATVWFGQRL